MSRPTRVWAPDATTVTCHVRPAGVVTPEADVVLPMTRAADGWWEGRALPAGVDYAFDVDGAGPLPDPRSAWQPHGVHAFSRVFDASAFRWTDAGWRGRDARGAVTYELHVGTFTATGTLDALVGRQLKDLAAKGIEMIELMPLASFPGSRGWGYDGVGLYAVHEAYGGPEALQRVVDAAHAVGIGVCLDVVYNHLGPEGNYLPRFGPYFTDAHHTPWGWAVNFDQEGCEGARDFVIDNALRWFEDFHIDALRLDAVHELVDESPVHILAELSTRTAELAERLGRPLSLVAETALNEVQLVTPVGGVTREGKPGLGMTAQWADDLHHALHAYLTGDTVEYYKEFGSAQALDKAYRDVFVRDTGPHTREGVIPGTPFADGVDRSRFVVCASNHDQVGNRPLGDRPSTVLNPGAQAAALALVLLSPFTPLVFMGEEYGEQRPFLFFTDLGDDLGPAVKKGREADFGGAEWHHIYGGPYAMPDPQDRQTFLRSKLGPGVAASGTTQHAIATWFAEVIAARPATLEPGAWELHPVSITESAPRQLTMSGPVRVVANLSGEPMTVGGRALARFGVVTTESSALILGPDAVVLMRPEEAS